MSSSFPQGQHHPVSADEPVCVGWSQGSHLIRRLAERSLLLPQVRISSAQSSSNLTAEQHENSVLFQLKGPGRISIARYTRSAARLRVHRPLAPGSWFNFVSRTEYEARYASLRGKVFVIAMALKLEVGLDVENIER
jgi:hypothetical protein